MGELVRKFRAGQITATVWSNEKEFEGKKTVIESIQFSKSYSDDDGKTWKETNSLSKTDVPKAIAVLQLAYNSVVVKEE